ncbi:MAG: glycosyltransferase [Herminiimonas sp.]|nr:glycosyltransferase [Herminiimonas sp.]
MIEQPLVSVVIPAYNHGTYLDAAIHSVLAQDYLRVELIVIDDGSTDHTREVLKGHEGRFHFESQPNSGQVATLNKGWQLSRGDILAYLSADDLLLQSAISSAVNCLKENPDAVLAYCDFNLIDPNSKIVRQVTTSDFDYGEMVSKLLCFPGPGAFFRRSAFEKAGLWDKSFRQMPDYEYWLRLGLCGRFVRVPKVLAAFRVHPTSLTFISSSPDEPIKIIKNYFGRTDITDEIRALKNKTLSNAHLLSAQLYLRAGCYRLGALNLRDAFILDRTNFYTLMLVRRIANALFNRVGHKVLWNLKKLLRN